MQHRRWLIAVLAAALIGGCGGGQESEPGTAETEAREPAETEARERRDRARPLDFDRVETVAGGLEVPWGLAFVDEDTILVTERPGRVRLVEDGRLRPEPLAELEVMAEADGGVLGIAVHLLFSNYLFA